MFKKKSTKGKAATGGSKQQPTSPRTPPRTSSSLQEAPSPATFAEQFFLAGLSTSALTLAQTVRENPNAKSVSSAASERTEDFASCISNSAESIDDERIASSFENSEKEYLGRISRLIFGETEATMAGKKKKTKKTSGSAAVPLEITTKVVDMPVRKINDAAKSNEVKTENALTRGPLKESTDISAKVNETPVEKTDLPVKESSKANVVTTPEKTVATPVKQLHETDTPEAPEETVEISMKEIDEKNTTETPEEKKEIPAKGSGEKNTAEAPEEKKEIPEKQFDETNTAEAPEEKKETPEKQSDKTNTTAEAPKENTESPEETTGNLNIEADKIPEETLRSEASTEKETTESTGSQLARVENFNISQFVYDATKAVWGFGCDIGVIKPFFKLAEGVAGKVIGVTTGLHLENGDEEIKPKFAAFDEAFLNPIISKVFHFVPPVFRKGA